MMVPCSHSLLASRQFSATLLLLMLILFLSACTKRARDHRPTTQTEANDQQSPTLPQTNSASSNQDNPERININTASAKELEKLPGIGKGLAARIIEHREKYGPFRRPEHLIIVRGISDRRFRAMQDLITVR